ncbi:tRNA-dihydrouridine synthase family protein [bacterium]|nr:tRNA-dihydrouridine synthase family protein [bacterium]
MISSSPSSPLLLLAPMEGLTNFHMRELLLEIGGMDIVATEFIRITSAKQTLAPILRHDHRTPLQIQLMASESEALSGVIVHLKKKGILRDDDWIDLNVGCPSRKVNASGAGAALLKTPKKLSLMLTEMRRVHPDGKLSLKTRLGYNSSEDFPALLSVLQDTPIDLITLHARTRCDGYDPDALEYDKLALAVEMLPYPVIGNGEIFTPHRAKEMLSTTGVAGVMCGRGAMMNPYLFQDIRDHLRPSPQQPEPHHRRAELYAFALAYLTHLQAEEAKHHRSRVGPYKEFATWFSKNPLIGPSYFQGIKRAKDTAEIARLTAEAAREQLEPQEFPSTSLLKTNL